METTTDATTPETPATQAVLDIPATSPMLQMTINRDALLNELSYMQSIVSSNRLGSPALSFVRFEGVGAGATGKLTLEATDLNRSLSSTISATIGTPGAICIQARKLFDYVRLLDAGEITFRALENGWVSVHSGRSHAKMTGIGVSSFPALPFKQNEGKEMSVPVDALKQMIARTLFAVSKEESRYTLQGAMFEVSNERMAMISTDGHRLAYFERDEKVDGVKQASATLIPLPALQDLGKLMEEIDASAIGFSESDSTLFFTLGNRQYSVRKLSGQFPNYKQVIPKGNDKTIIVPAGEFGQAVRRVMEFSDARSGGIRITLAENCLTLSASTDEAGQTEETIDVVYHGAPLTTGLSGGYLLDYLKSIGGEGEVKLEFKDANSALLLKREGEQDADAFALQMPMRA